MKNPTSDPMMPSARLPPMEAADFNTVCALSMIQPLTCSAETGAVSRIHRTAPPMTGIVSRRSSRSG